MLKTMNKLIICRNPLDTETWETYETNDIILKMSGMFPHFPDNARLYHNEVSVLTDVTPVIESDIESLQKKEGVFFMVLYPEALAVVAIVIAVVAIAAAFFIKPKVPQVNQKNSQSQSPNNELSDRQNQARPNERVPYICGTVRSIPDLACVPYKTFDANQEVEHCTMCVGEGEYQIHGAWDDETPFAEVAGNSLQVYHPNESINAATPYYVLGTPFVNDVYNPKKSSAITGQTLRAPNNDQFTGAFNVSFMYPNSVILDGTDSDFTDYFAPDDVITISNASFSGSYIGDAYDSYATAYRFHLKYVGTPPGYVSGQTVQISNAQYPYDGGTNSFDLSGVYTILNTTLETVGSDTYFVLIMSATDSNSGRWQNFVNIFGSGSTESTTVNVTLPGATYNVNGTYSVLAVSSGSMTLDNPSAVNADWDVIAGFDGDRTQNTSPTITTSAERWIGPYSLSMETRTRIIANFVALNGIYLDDGDQHRSNVEVEMGVQQLDSNNNPVGAEIRYTANLIGSSTSKDTVGLTLDIDTPFTGKCEVRFRRITPENKEYNGSVVDEVKVRDLYAVEVLSTDDCNFGNVSMLRSKTYATPSALAIKDRKLRLLVTRMMPTLQVDGTFTPYNVPTNLAHDIFCAVALAPTIGNRNLNELDAVQIYATINEVRAYFGTDLAAEFCYTFDDNNISYEETALTIADAVFCKAYRRGSSIKLTFEKETDSSVMLFNHRNKLPGSETRTVTFGYINDNDGIELDYVSPEDDAKVTFYLPADQSALNPKKLDTVGIRSVVHAHFLAWRAYNKIRFQNTATEFTATHESNLLLLTDRILNSDNTRPATMEGEVVSVNGLELTLSQKSVFESGKSYSIFLQLSDSTVESIVVTAGSTDKKVILQSAPRLPLVTDSANYAKTTYQIVASDDTRQRAFIVNEKEPDTNYTNVIRAVNYDSRYYEHDKDFINGVISED